MLIGKTPRGERLRADLNPLRVHGRAPDLNAWSCADLHELRVGRWKKVCTSKERPARAPLGLVLLCAVVASATRSW